MFQLSYLILTCLCFLIESRLPSRPQEICAEVQSCIFDPVKNSNNQPATYFELAGDSALFNQYCVLAAGAADCFASNRNRCTEQSTLVSIGARVDTYTFTCSNATKTVIRRLTNSVCMKNRTNQVNSTDAVANCSQLLTERMWDTGERAPAYTQRCNIYNEWHTCRENAARLCGKESITFHKIYMDFFSSMFMPDIIPHCPANRNTNG